MSKARGNDGALIQRVLKGRLEILYRHHPLRFLEIAKPSRLASRIQTRLPPRSTKPRPEHPWRRFRLALAAPA